MTQTKTSNQPDRFFVLINQASFSDENFEPLTSIVCHAVTEYWNRNSSFKLLKLMWITPCGAPSSSSSQIKTHRECDDSLLLFYWKVCQWGGMGDDCESDEKLIEPGLSVISISWLKRSHSKNCLEHYSRNFISQSTKRRRQSFSLPLPDQNLPIALKMERNHPKRDLIYSQHPRLLLMAFYGRQNCSELKPKMPRKNRKFDSKLITEQSERKVLVIFMLPLNM